MFSEGDRIAAYELMRRLGGGAFGEVWLVRHMDLGVERAMKIPTDPDYVRQLRQEGKIQFQLHHPNVVETVDLNTMHDPPYFVMEYVEGQDLRKRLKADGKLPVDEALDIIRQVLDAMEHAHGQGVLHRDLKPENILVAADGRVKITDFGLGKVQADVAQSLLLSGSMMSSQGVSVSGTFQYMSPEQQAGRQADPRDDLYAVGIVGCELMTGNRPSAVGIARSMGYADVPQGVSEVFEKACDPREYRYAGVEEMRSAVVSMIRELAEQRERQRREEEQHRLEAEGREQEQQRLLVQRRREEQESQQRAEERKRQEEQRCKEADLIYTMKGAVDVLEVFEHKVRITPKGVWGFLNKKGTREIPFASVVAIQFKEASALLNGYLQFTIPGGKESRGGMGGILAMPMDENAFMFGHKKNNALAIEIKEYIDSAVRESRTPQAATPTADLSDELQKLAKPNAERTSATALEALCSAGRASQDSRRATDSVATPPGKKKPVSAKGAIGCLAVIVVVILLAVLGHHSKSPKARREEASERNPRGRDAEQQRSPEQNHQSTPAVGFLGVTMPEIDEKLLKVFRLPEHKGALVMGVLPDTPADKAGIREEDVIIAVGSRQITSRSELSNAVAAVRRGDTVPVIVLRNAKKITLNILIESRSRETKSINSRPRSKRALGSTEQLHRILEDHLNALALAGKQSTSFGQKRLTDQAVAVTTTRLDRHTFSIMVPISDVVSSGAGRIGVKFVRGVTMGQSERTDWKLCIRGRGITVQMNSARAANIKKGDKVVLRGNIHLLPYLGRVLVGDIELEYTTNTIGRFHFGLFLTEFTHEIQK